VLRETQVPIPRAWEHRKYTDVSCHLVPAPESVRRAIERGLRATAHSQCVGRDGTGKTRESKVVKVERIENLALWKAYHHRKAEMTDTHHANCVQASPLSPAAVPIAPPSASQPAGVLDEDGLLEPRLNETFLYHGTSHDVAGVIARHGFDERVAALNGLYGAGVYFANQSCKSAQYANDPGLKTLIIARVTLGDPYYAPPGAPLRVRRPPERTKLFNKGVTFDSVVANSGGSQAHRELIIYDHKQAYPEYIVTFKPG
jgi:hypothetical protein